MVNCHTCVANLAILDLRPPVSDHEIKAAYRDMAKVWHPDRFQGDARLSAKAEEQFKRIQKAHQELLVHLPIHAASRGNTHRHENVTAKHDILPATLNVLRRWSDNRRFFVEPISEQIIGSVKECHRGLTRLLGLVDFSLTPGTACVYLAFTPEGLVYKRVAYNYVVELIGYDRIITADLRVGNVRDTSSFFDRLASEWGLGAKPDSLELTVELGKTTITAELSSDEGQRLLHLLSDLKKTLQS